MIDSALINRVSKLPVSERLEFMGAIWQTLGPKDAPVSEEEKRLLDSRLKDIEENPEDQSSWAEAHQRLKNQLP